MITKQMQKYGKVNLQAHGKASSSDDTAFIHFILPPQMQQKYANMQKFLTLKMIYTNLIIIILLFTI